MGRLPPESLHRGSRTVVLSHSAPMLGLQSEWEKSHTLTSPRTTVWAEHQPGVEAHWVTRGQAAPWSVPFRAKLLWLGRVKFLQVVILLCPCSITAPVKSLNVFSVFFMFCVRVKLVTCSSLTHSHVSLLSVMGSTFISESFPGSSVYA